MTRRLVFLTPEFVTEPYFSGGVANYINRLSFLFAQAGHDVHVVTLSDREEALWHGKVRVHRIMEREYIPRLTPGLRRLGLWATEEAVRRSLRFAQEVKRLHREAPLDLVHHCHNAFPTLFLPPRFPVPVLVMIASFDALWQAEDGLPVNYDRWTCNLFHYFQHRRATRIFSPSHWLIDVHRERWGLKNIDFLPIPMVLHDIRETPGTTEKLGLSGKPYFLFFGRFQRLKGVNHLAEAVARTLPENPEWHAVFAGRDSLFLGPDVPMSQYIRHVTEKVAPRVHLLPPLRHEELYPVIRQAQFVVLPTRADNLPNVLLEAIRLGKPVLTTYGTSMDEVIQDGYNGILVNKGNTDALVQGLQRMISLPENERERMGCNAFETSLGYEEDRLFPEIVRYYESLIRERHG